MRNETALERLRDANPIRPQQGHDEALFHTIIAGVGDSRLSTTIRPRPRRRRRWQLAAVAASALVVGVATAWAAGTDVRDLFAFNPAGGGTPEQPTTGLWHQVAIPSTVRQAGVMTIPHVGRLRFWYAETEQHGWCTAIRMQGGEWAGTKGASGGSTAPGCYPSRTQTNAASGTPVYVITGLDYYESDLDARDEGGRFWRVIYGVTEQARPAARVVDTVSGRDVDVLSGRFFAIAVADDHPGVASPTPLTHLVAYDANGKVIADASKPLP
jgi:hypothetical protein